MVSISKLTCPKQNSQFYSLGLVFSVTRVKNLEVTLDLALSLIPYSEPSSKIYFSTFRIYPESKRSSPSPPLAAWLRPPPSLAWITGTASHSPFCFWLCLLTFSQHSSQSETKNRSSISSLLCSESSSGFIIFRINKGPSPHPGVQALLPLCLTHCAPGTRPLCGFPNLLPQSLCPFTAPSAWDSLPDVDIVHSFTQISLSQ